MFEVSFLRASGMPIFRAILYHNPAEKTSGKALNHKQNGNQKTKMGESGILVFAWNLLAHIDRQGIIRAVCFWNGNKLKLRMEKDAVRKQENIIAIKIKGGQVQPGWRQNVPIPISTTKNEGLDWRCVRFAHDRLARE